MSHRKLWVSRHRSHRYTCGVCFCLECSTIFSREGRHLVLGLPRASKSSFLLMTNQNINTPALYHQNQHLDSGSVHESHRRKLWLSRHRRHRDTCRVCFCLKVSYIFRGDKKRSLSCSSSGHQKSVSADDKSKHNKPSPLSPEPTSWLGLCTRVTAAAALAIAAWHSPPYICVRFCHTVLQVQFSVERSGTTDFLAALRFSWRLPFENLRPRFCQEGTFPAIWKSWEDF